MNAGRMFFGMFAALIDGASVVNPNAPFVRSMQHGPYEAADARRTVFRGGVFASYAATMHER